ncbi:hypothetical protein BC830DRAFT_1234285 [Chytriomyces sp. MP71]|nr:hypothetical protein BC830DRAFT_1234285 [Chytriomyces sp. MP71]
MSGNLPGGDFTSIHKWLRSLPSSSSLDRLGSSMEDLAGTTIHSYDNPLALVGERSKKWDKDIKLKDKEREDMAPNASSCFPNPKPLPAKDLFNEVAMQDGISRQSPLKALVHSSEPARLSQLVESSATAPTAAQHSAATISASSSLDIVRNSGDHINDTSSIISFSLNKTQSLASVANPILQNNLHHKVSSASEAVGEKKSPLQNGRKKITAKHINTIVFSDSDSCNSYTNVVESLVSRSSDGFAEMAGSQISTYSLESDDSRMKGKIGTTRFTSSGPIFSSTDNKRKGSHLSTTMSLPQDVETNSVEIAETSSTSYLPLEHSEDDISVARTSVSQAGGSCLILEDKSLQHHHLSDNFLPLRPQASNSTENQGSSVPTTLGVSRSNVVATSSDELGDFLKNPLFRKFKRGSLDQEHIKDPSHVRDASSSSDEDGSRNSGSKNSKDSWRQSIESEPTKQYSPRVEKKRITAAMLNQFKAEKMASPPKLSADSLSESHPSSNGQSNEILLPESVSNLGLQKSSTGSSICLDDLRKEFLSGPTSLAPNTHKSPEHHSLTTHQIKTLKGILKSESISKPATAEPSSLMVPSHESLHEAINTKKVVRWDKTRVYVFEQSEEEGLLRGDGSSKKDKKRDLMRI